MGGRFVLQKLVHARDGVTAIEYGLICGLVVLAIIVGARLIGADLVAIFTNVHNGVTTSAA
jgi:pilus assembly protein Flp/PilA